jgi:hypothetical protein
MFPGRQGKTGGEMRTVDASHTGIPVREKNEKSALILPQSRQPVNCMAVHCSISLAFRNARCLLSKLFMKSSKSPVKARAWNFAKTSQISLHPTYSPKILTKKVIEFQWICVNAR